MVQGRITKADTLTIRLGATPSGLTSAHLHHPHIFYTPDALPAAQPTSVKSLKVKTYKKTEPKLNQQLTLELLMCLCVSLCTTVIHNKVHNSSDNLPSYPPDSNHCSDDCLPDGKRDKTTAHTEMLHFRKTRVSRTESVIRSRWWGISSPLCENTYSTAEDVAGEHRTTHHNTTGLRPFFRDHPGEPVPEENFWTLWCKGRLTKADRPSGWAPHHPD